MRDYLKALNQYADFRGRASRREFFNFCLFNFLFFAFAVAIDWLAGLGSEFFPFGYLTVSYVVATTIPGIAVQVRRIHDTGHGGWHSVFRSGLIWHAGDVGENDYGPDPLEIERSKKLIS